jgi:hypothetical protein
VIADFIDVLQQPASLLCVDMSGIGDSGYRARDAAALATPLLP